MSESEQAEFLSIYDNYSKKDDINFKLIYKQVPQLLVSIASERGSNRFSKQRRQVFRLSHEILQYCSRLGYFDTQIKQLEELLQDNDSKGHFGTILYKVSKFNNNIVPYFYSIDKYIDGLDKLNLDSETREKLKDEISYIVHLCYEMSVIFDSSKSEAKTFYSRVIDLGITRLKNMREKGTRIELDDNIGFFELDHEDEKTDNEILDSYLDLIVKHKIKNYNILVKYKSEILKFDKNFDITQKKEIWNKISEYYKNTITN